MITRINQIRKRFLRLECLFELRLEFFAQTLKLKRNGLFAFILDASGIKLYFFRIPLMKSYSFIGSAQSNIKYPIRKTIKYIRSLSNITT